MAMTLNELIAELNEHLEQNPGEGELEVMTSHDYGDHCHHEALNHIREVVKIVPRETAYSPTDLCVPDDSDLWENQPDSNDHAVIVLRF